MRDGDENRGPYHISAHETVTARHLLGSHGEMDGWRDGWVHEGRGEWMDGQKDSGLRGQRWLHREN